MFKVAVTLLLAGTLAFPAAASAGDPLSDTDRVILDTMRELGKADAVSGGEQAATPEELFSLGEKKLTGNGCAKDPAGAVMLLSRAAEKGHTEAMVLLGVCLYTGNGTPKDLKAAAAWARRAADLGDADGQSFLGALYADGTGVPKNKSEAVRWWRRAAERGQVTAQSSLGRALFSGDGVPPNAEEAVRWWAKAAAAGDAEAQFGLGVAYGFGTGVPRDLNASASWAARAADQGYAHAQYLMGIFFLNGDVFPRDDAKAAEWFLRAAKQGVADAQFALGQCYADGRGVPVDVQEAVRWWRRAAEQGYAEAQTCLEAYRRGGLNGSAQASRGGVPATSQRSAGLAGRDACAEAIADPVAMTPRNGWHTVRRSLNGADFEKHGVRLYLEAQAAASAPSTADEASTLLAGREGGWWSLAIAPERGPDGTEYAMAAGTNMDGRCSAMLFLHGPQCAVRVQIVGRNCAGRPAAMQSEEHIGLQNYLTNFMDGAGTLSIPLNTGAWKSAPRHLPYADPM